MEEIIKSIFVLITGALAGFFASISGGGGLISIPALILIGIPPHVAIATNRFGALGASLGGLKQFIKKNKVSWKYVGPFSILAIAGGFIGSELLLLVDEKTINIVVAIILIAIIPLIFIDRERGIRLRQVSSNRKLVGYLVFFLVMIWGGFFGGGAGIALIFTIMYFFGLPIIDASATRKIPWFLFSILATFIFIFNGIVHIGYGVLLIVGAYIGGVIGAKTALKKGNRWVKAFFAIIIVASSLKLLFF